MKADTRSFSDDKPPIWPMANAAFFPTSKDSSANNSLSLYALPVTFIEPKALAAFDLT